MIDTKNKEEQNKKAEEECHKLTSAKLKVLEFFDNLNTRSTKVSKINFDNKGMTKKNSDPTSDSLPTKYELQKDESSLKHISFVVHSIFEFMRQDQNFVYKLLTVRNITKKDKIILSSFITNFFYENMLSYSLIDNEYLLLLYRTLKLEISSLEFSHKPLDFLPDHSINSFLFLSLNNKNFVKAFFKKILQPVVNKMELGDKTKLILFSPDQINNIFESNPSLDTNQNQIENTKTLKEMRQDSERSNEARGQSSSDKTEDSIISDLLESENIFSEEIECEYGSIFMMDLNREDIAAQISKEKNQDMLDYLIHKFISFNKKNSFYSSSRLKRKISSLPHCEKILNSYKQSFSFTMSIIKTLIDNLEKNIELVPYPIKCLCKIIDELLKIKFPSIYKYERISFISQLFYEKLLKPILIEPDIKCGLSELYLSNITSKNLKQIQYILSFLFSGKLFNEKVNYPYTPFNICFVELFPKIMSMFDKMLQVHLPSKIESLLDKEDGSFKVTQEETERYDFFKENPEDKIRHISICYSVEDFETIINLIRNNQDSLLEPYADGDISNKFYKGCKKFFEDVKTSGDEPSSFYYNELKKCKIGYETYNPIKQSPTIQEKKGKKSVKETNENPNEGEVPFDGIIKRFFLIQRLEIEKSFEQQITPKKLKFLSLEGKHKKQKQINEPEVYNILEIKKNLTEFFLKYHTLNYNEIKDCQTLKDILMKLFQLSEVDYYLMNDSYSLEWNYLSICQSIENLGENHLYVINELNGLLNELLDELNQTTEHLSLDPFLCVLESFSYSKAELNEVNEFYKKLKKTQINKYIQSFVENFPQEIFTGYENTNDINTLKIVDNFTYSKNHKDTRCYVSGKKFEGVYSKTILQFIKKFPNPFVNDDTVADQLEVEMLMKYPEQIQNYLTLTNKQLVNNLELNKVTSNIKEITLYSTELREYIMKRLYPKIFPKTPCPQDVQIMEQCNKLAWVEPKHFEKIEFIDNFDYYIEEIKKHLTNLDEWETPLKKASSFCKINDLCFKIAKHTQSIKEVAVDDTLELIIYSVIKSKPKCLYSNIKFIELFLSKEDKKGSMAFSYSNIESAYTFILSMEKLKGVDREEFIK